MHVIFALLFPALALGLSRGGYNSITLCGNEDTRIRCYGGTITVLDVFYGRNSDTICATDFMKNTACTSKIAAATVKRNCDGKSSCFLTASSKMFADPCQGTTKYLQVRYLCFRQVHSFPGRHGWRLRGAAKALKNMQKDIFEMKKELEAEKLKVSALEKKGNPIAFLASLSKTIRNPAPGLVIKFDHVILNKGSNYDKSTGIFTAPIDGAYYFSLEASSEPGKSSRFIHLLLMKGTERMGYVFLDHNTDRWLKRSTTATMMLKRGDNVWCKIRGARHSTLNGAGLHTTFTGFYIK